MRYTDLSLLALILSLLSGATLWWQRERKQFLGWTLFAAGAGGGLALMTALLL